MAGKSVLEQLKEMTLVVADTANFELLEKFSPQDATTNPSLVMQAISLPQFSHFIAESVAAARAAASATTPAAAVVDDAMDRVLVAFGCQILKRIPGRVSTEVDARLSFDTAATIAKALRIAQLYREAGIDPAKRLLIKVASTWEGIRAAEALEKSGLHCNLTLLFSFVQAHQCAAARVTLISPFVGRILDWHKKAHPDADLAGEKDPGVVAVSRVWRYYKRHGIPTTVMGASFRNTDEVRRLAGCDALTISPALLAELAADTTTTLTPALSAEAAAAGDEWLGDVSEAVFRREMNEDAMASDKLAEGIRLFAADARKLEALVRAEVAKSA